MRGGSAEGLFIKRMRDIKFRGRTQAGKWVYGYYAKFAHDSVPVILEDTENGIAPRKIIPETVCQFTGLHDKNGREIYEGDIIESQGYSHARHYVRYIDDEAMFVAMIIGPGASLMDFCSIKQSWIDKYDKKIIGNIYDDPELL